MLPLFSPSPSDYTPSNPHSAYRIMSLRALGPLPQEFNSSSQEAEGAYLPNSTELNISPLSAQFPNHACLCVNPSSVMTSGRSKMLIRSDVDAYLRSMDAVYCKSHIHLLPGPTTDADVDQGVGSWLRKIVLGLSLDTSTPQLTLQGAQIVKFLCELGLGYVSTNQVGGLTGLFDIQRAVLQIGDPPIPEAMGYLDGKSCPQFTSNTASRHRRAKEVEKILKVKKEKFDTTFSLRVSSNVDLVLEKLQLHHEENWLNENLKNVLKCMSKLNPPAMVTMELWMITPTDPYEVTFVWERDILGVASVRGNWDDWRKDVMLRKGERMVVKGQKKVQFKLFVNGTSIMDPYLAHVSHPQYFKVHELEFEDSPTPRIASFFFKDGCTEFFTSTAHSEKLIAADIAHPSGQAVYIATRFYEKTLKSVQAGYMLAFAECKFLSGLGFQLWDLGGVNLTHMMSYKNVVADRWERTRARHALRQCTELEPHTQLAVGMAIENL
eukprot:Platyproteum_vivax@DN2151_c0_g1_i1.p1